jgi:hypothetical protein
MAINVVENVQGVARVNWTGASVLAIGVLIACAMIPALGMWLAFADAKLVGTAMAVGFSMSCSTLPMLILQQLRLPLDRLPMHFWIE